jgi:hypothetical protein
VLVSGDDTVVVASLGVACGLASCGPASCVVSSVGSDVVVTALSGNVARVADFMRLECSVPSLRRLRQ